MARILRIFAAKELFDAVIGLLNWLLSKGVPDVVQTAPGEHVALWALFSLVVSILLFRYASILSRWLTNRPRLIARGLNLGDNLWLSIGVRSLGVWSLLRGLGLFLQGFVHAAAPARNATGTYSGAYYLMWAVVYLLAGLLFAKRPDAVGIVVTTPGKTENSAV